MNDETDATMPLDVSIVNPRIDPLATDVSATINAMAVGETYKRLHLVLEMLGKDVSDLYRETALSQAYVAKLKAGTIGKKRPHHLAMEMQRAYGVPPDIWTSSKLDWSPENSNHPKSVLPLDGGGLEMGVLSGAQRFASSPVDLRRELVRMAIELDEPKEVQLEILSVEPPPDATEAWWFRQYVEIVRRARKSLRK